MTEVQELAPISFDEIVGNKEVLVELKKGLQKRTFSGSYLFFGPKGGRTTS